MPALLLLQARSPVSAPALFPLVFTGNRPLVIGRRRGLQMGDITLDDMTSSVSREHVHLTRIDGRCFVQDTSRHGTCLNCRPVPKLYSSPLTHGDLLRITFYPFQFLDDDPAGGGLLASRPFDPAWRTEHTVGLAAKMHDERSLRALPILADALEEAGCDNQDILSHCREPGEHGLGCWVVDLVLGKS